MPERLVPFSGIWNRVRQFFSWQSAARRGPLLFVAGVLAAFIVLFTVVAPLIAGFVENWGRSDVALRARTINASARDQVVALLRQPATDAEERLQGFFAEILSDERLAGVAVCNRSGTLRIATQGFPVGVSCDDIGQSEGEVTTPLSIDGRTLLASSFPLPQPELGHLVVVHDLTYALSRAGEARLYLSITLGAVIVLATGVAGIISWLLLRSWQNTLRGTPICAPAGRTAPSLQSRWTANCVRHLSNTT